MVFKERLIMNYTDMTLKEEKQMGVASLFLGIFALLVSILTRFFGCLGVILAIMGIIFGAIGRKRAGKHKLATAGMVCSIISLILGVIIIYLAWYV